MASPLGELAVARRFIIAWLSFVSLVLLTTLVFALLMSPARPAPLEPSGCERNLSEALGGVQAMQLRVKNLGEGGSAESCAAARLYFLELVKARAVTALCRSGSERERELGRLDSDVEQINNAIASRCQ